MTIAAICFTMVLTLALPLGLMLWLKKRGGKWMAFAIGAGTFFLFAMVLEQAVHSLVLGGPLFTELIVAAATVVTVLLAARVYKKVQISAENT